MCLFRCLDILSNTDNLYSIRFANLGAEGEEVVAQFMAAYADKREPGQKSRSRVRFASTTSGIAPPSRDDLSTLAGRQNELSQRTSRRNGSISSMAFAPDGSKNTEQQNDEGDTIDSFLNFRLPSIHKNMEVISLTMVR